MKEERKEQKRRHEMASGGRTNIHSVNDREVQYRSVIWSILIFLISAKDDVLTASDFILVFPRDKIDFGSTFFIEISPFFVIMKEGLNSVHLKEIYCKSFYRTFEILNHIKPNDFWVILNRRVLDLSSLMKLLDEMSNSDKNLAVLWLFI